MRARDLATSILLSASLVGGCGTILTLAGDPLDAAAPAVDDAAARDEESGDAAAGGHDAADARIDAAPDAGDGSPASCATVGARCDPNDSSAICFNDHVCKACIADVSTTCSATFECCINGNGCSPDTSSSLSGKCSKPCVPREAGCDSPGACCVPFTCVPDVSGSGMTCQ